MRGKIEMSIKNTKKEIAVVTKFALKLAIIAAVVLIGANLTKKSHAYDEKNKVITIGTTVGDFSILVNQGLKPELEKKGYKIKHVEFTDYVRPNIALSEGALDVNIFQHKPYLDEFAQEKNLQLSILAPVPTAPLGLYPGKLKNLADFKEGESVAIPNDPTNLARALVIFQELGWIKLSKNVNPLKASVKDIEKNLKNIKIVQLEAAQLPRSLTDVDFAVINGNYATASGIAISSAVAREKNDNYINYAVVRSTDLKVGFAKDFADVLRSSTFKTFAKNRFKGYKFPAEWK
jgi:D-methionine transport system substrate-binding protein